MSYNVTTTAGVTLASIVDGTINSSATSLTLVGKNYAGYGLFLNENYVKLLENFSNTAAPTNALTGQLWYDSTNNVLKVYNGSIWKSISSSTAASSSPISPVTGDLWWDTSSSQLKVWSGSIWVTVGPTYTSTAGTSGAIVETILDTSSIGHVVVKFYISNSVIAVLSKDTTFTPQTSILGFTTIQPGMNLISSSTLAGAQFTGNSSGALTLNGISTYLRSDQNTSTAYRITATGGIVVGSDLTIASAIGAVSLTNSTNNSDMNLWVNKGGVSTKAIGINGTTAAVTLPGNFIAQGTASVTGNLTTTGYTLSQGITIASNHILPNATNTINIGASGTKFANMYVTTLTGNVTGNVTGTILTAAQTNITSVGTLTALSVTGNVTTGNVSGTIVTASGYMKNAVYATTAARDAAITSPTAGMQVFVTTGTTFYGYTGSAWVALN